MAKKATPLASHAENTKIPQRRFEFKDDQSYKFWSIELDDDSHTVTYGRIGNAGRSVQKDFATAAEAKASYDKQIQQKVKKGYKEVTKPAAPKKSEAEIRGEREAHEPFEQMIMDDPRDIGCYAVYSDWLTERGDPRGEFMRIQLELEDPKLSFRRRIDLQKLEQSMLARHCRTWLGELTRFLVDQKGADEGEVWLGREKCFEFQFQLGLLAEVVMRKYSHEFSLALRDSQHARMLRRLIIEQTPSLTGTVEIGEHVIEVADSLETLVGTKFENLRYFQLGFKDLREFGDDMTRGMEAVPLIRDMPNIEAIHVAAHSVDIPALFSMPLPTLRSLTLQGLWPFPLKVLAKNETLTNLRVLRFHTSAPRLGSGLDEFREIARSDYLVNLTQLQFWNSDLGDDAIDELIASDLLRRLKVLDLSHGSITDRGAARLAECSDLPQLDHLILWGNEISRDGIRLLKQTGVNLTMHRQGVEELDYLWLGDW